MVSLEQLKTSLLHSDELRRDYARSRLVNAPRQNEALVGWVLESVDLFDWEEWIDDLRRIDLPADPALGWNLLRDRLASTPPEIRQILETLLSRAPFALPAAEIDALEASGAVSYFSVERMRRRLALSRWTGERLWSELIKAANRPFEEVPYNAVEDLLDALELSQTPSNEEILAYADEQEELPRDESDPAALYADELLGRRRCVEAVPGIVRRLTSKLAVTPSIEDPGNPEEIDIRVDALNRIDHPAVVAEIRSVWREAAPEERLTLGDVIEHLTCPEADALVLERLLTERDATVRTEMCRMVCERLCAEGFDAVKREIKKGWDDSQTDLRLGLINATEILGIELPERVKWLTEIKKEIEDGADEFDDGGEPENDEDADQGDGPVTPPAVRVGPKVGRNDPCPCGSGKKYKKCCAAG